MNREDQLKYATRVVDRLIMQYGEYVALSEKISELEKKHFAKVALIAKNRQITVHEAIAAMNDSDENKYEEICNITANTELLKIDLDRLSDEMSFANPLIWMMYKYKAYKGTSTEIATLGDLRKHCEPEGYICTIRFGFLSEYLQDSKNINLADKDKYPDTLSLEEFYESSEILDLGSDPSFMKEWKGQEYLISENRINKWGSNNP